MKLQKRTRKSYAFIDREQEPRYEKSCPDTLSNIEINIIAFLMGHGRKRGFTTRGKVISAISASPMFLPLRFAPRLKLPIVIPASCTKPKPEKSTVVSPNEKY